MIPKSCRLFGPDHAQNQEIQSAIRFNLNGSRLGFATRLRRPAMVRTILVNLRNYGQWLPAAATFVVRTERTVVALTPPPLVIGPRLLLFTAQRVWHRPSHLIVTVKIAQAVEYYVFRSIFGNEDYNLARLRRWPDIKALYDGMVADGRTPLILDCGANIGLSAVYFALEFPAARIVAVEPQPENFRRAVAATAAFPQVKVIEAGVASTPASAPMPTGPSSRPAAKSAWSPSPSSCAMRHRRCRSSSRSTSRASRATSS